MLAFLKTKTHPNSIKINFLPRREHSLCSLCHRFMLYREINSMHPQKNSKRVKALCGIMHSFLMLHQVVYIITTVF
jgi:hypothetical protein